MLGGGCPTRQSAGFYFKQVTLYLTPLFCMEHKNIIHGV